MKRNFLWMIAAACLLFSGCRFLWFGASLKLSGTLEFTEHSLGAPVPGRLAQVLVREGDAVKKGQLLATLERYEQAQRDYERVKELYKTGGANRQTLEEAELAMNDQRVVSPVDGVVLVKVHEAGEVLPAGSPVFVVGDRGDLWVRVFVPEGSVSRVDMKGPATLHFDGLDHEFKGHVIYVSPEAEFTPRNVQTPEERMTQTFAVKVALEDAPDYLRPGVAADVKLALKDR